MTKERIHKEIEQTTESYLLKQPDHNMEIGDCKLHLSMRKVGKSLKE